MISSKHIFYICIFLFFFIFAPVMASAEEINLSGIADYSVESTTVQADLSVDTQAISLNHFRGFQIAGSLYAGLGVGARIELAYLWGNDVLLGISLNGYYIVPYLGGADVRAKLVFALTPNDGITMSAGIGGGTHAAKYYYAMQLEYDVELSGDDSLYIPVQIGYDHVFDNGFLLGVSLEAHMAFIHINKCGKTQNMAVPGGGWDWRTAGICVLISR